MDPVALLATSAYSALAHGCQSAATTGISTASRVASALTGSIRGQDWWASADAVQRGEDALGQRFPDALGRAWHNDTRNTCAIAVTVSVFVIAAGATIFGGEAIEGVAGIGDAAAALLGDTSAEASGGSWR